jgi:hypothetical protein
MSLMRDKDLFRVTLILAVLGAAACTAAVKPPAPRTRSTSLASGISAATGISAALFRHHYVSRDLPTDRPAGYAPALLGDFDRDGKLDFAWGSTGETLYWHRYEGKGRWSAPRPVGLVENPLGGATYDIDGDGWPDMITGRFWYRNDGNGGFTRYDYDPEIGKRQVHDLVITDITGDGRPEVVTLGDEIGLHWYRIPDDPAGTLPWPRTLVTDDVLKKKEHIHAGFFPGGVADVDGDGDADIVTARFLYENLGGAESWKRHELPFAKTPGPFGWSARSVVVDINRDGRADIVMTDEKPDARAAILFGQSGGGFKMEDLPLTAPGVRGSFHSLAVADFDLDGDLDIFTVEQEDPKPLPGTPPPRWYIWENLDGSGHRWAERVIFDGALGGHDAVIGDIDGDGDLDICSKIWKRSPLNANEGREHADCLENLVR